MKLFTSALVAFHLANVFNLAADSGERSLTKHEPTNRKSNVARPQRPPNVVMIISDDQAWNDFGFMGHPVIQTPHLDKLAAQSARFPNAYVPTPVCRPSLASILTGQYASQHKIANNDPPPGVPRTAMLPFIRNVPTVPRLLQQRGYESFQTGKFWEGDYASGGFTHGMTEKGRHGGPGIAIGRETMQPIYDFIEGRGERPFFIWYAPMMPHDPHTPPERILKKYRAEDRPEPLAKYWAMCEWFDETCGELLEYLDNKSLSENTLVVFAVDNGWIQETGDVRRHDAQGWFSPRSKLSPYEGGVRFPMLLRWPGRIKPGEYSNLVSSIDLAPTILEACGLEPDKQMPGLSLLHAAADKSPLKRKAVFGEVFHQTAVDLEKPALSLKYLWVREQEWKLIRSSDASREPELYHVSRDPYEEKNLAARERQRIQRLSRLIDQWQRQIQQ